MASLEQKTAWNKVDNEGSIQPPLSDAEINAFAEHGIYPETTVAYKSYRGMARTALIACAHIRIPDNPNLTAQALAAFR